MVVNLTRKLLAKLSRKGYRDEYVADHVRTHIAYQIKAIREQRGWNQGEFAEVIGKPQSVVCRLESPDYGKPTLNSLFEVASAFDVGLVVKFVTFPRFLQEYEDVSPDALRVDSYDETRFIPATDGSRYVADTVSRAHLPEVLMGVKSRGPTRTIVGEVETAVH